MQAKLMEEMRDNIKAFVYLFTSLANGPNYRAYGGLVIYLSGYQKYF